MKTALIFGINGMDGSHLSDLLLEKNYIVHGTIRRASTMNTKRINHIYNRLKIHYCDLTDAINVLSTISKIKPDEIYNFAAQSHVKVSADLENYTLQVNTLGILNILQAVKILGMDKICKIYHASTSEMFGNGTNGESKLSEESALVPVSIYGISKLAAHNICNMYKEAYNMFVVSSILFNHESERRGHNFVTQKISNYVAKFYHAQLRNEEIPPLELGNLNARRDWGDAKDYVKAIYLMLQQENPDNFVVATGETHSIREFLKLAFKEIGIDISFIGEGPNEKCINSHNGKILAIVNPKYYRDLEIDTLIGDYSKAKRILGWEPTNSFPNLVKDMVSAAILRNGTF